MPINYIFMACNITNFSNHRTLSLKVEHKSCDFRNLICNINLFEFACADLLLYITLNCLFLQLLIIIKNFNHEKLMALMLIISFYCNKYFLPEVSHQNQRTDSNLHFSLTRQVQLTIIRIDSD